MIQEAKKLCRAMKIILLSYVVIPHSEGCGGESKECREEIAIIKERNEGYHGKGRRTESLRFVAERTNRVLHRRNKGKGIQCARDIGSPQSRKADGNNEFLECIHYIINPQF